MKLWPELHVLLPAAFTACTRQLNSVAPGKPVTLAVAVVLSPNFASVSDDL
jgi:hypothetical protein